MLTNQANPLNTYLFSKPSFTSPQPLAAASGLTIPLQITLSEIKLSAFIILVFSRQKGLTLVFRNDPLESLKVSSTFDSIPFVCEYLQNEIEMQLRVLMMEELPAIIHRLSLRLWCPEYRSKEEETSVKTPENLKERDIVVDPFASPPQEAVDAHGNVLDAEEISSLSLEGRSETHSLFSQKNLLRLAALNDSQRTLSLFTPSIREAVFRAWAGPSERGDGSSPSTTPNLMRQHSAHGSTGTTYTFSDNGTENSQLPSRPSLVNLHSSTTGLSLGAGRHSRTHGRKKKNRVVNLRRSKTTDDSPSESGESESPAELSIAGGSEPVIPTQIPEEPDEELITPPRSPNRVRFRPREDSIDLGETPQRPRLTPSRTAEQDSRLPVGMTTQDALIKAMDIPIPSTEEKTPEPHITRPRPFAFSGTPSWTFPIEKSTTLTSNSSIPYRPSSPYIEAPSGGIIEQAWMMKMAGELARRAQEEKAAMARGWDTQGGRDDTPPPAYEAQ
jgi:mitochondrial distribution and morphology protein 34